MLMSAGGILVKMNRCPECQSTLVIIETTSFSSTEPSFVCWCTNAKCRYYSSGTRRNIFQPLVDLAKDYLGAIGNRPS